jgi:hypothetical protein
MLFKYADSARVDILQDLRIRFTPASEFNDPFEFMPDTSVLFDPKWLKESEDKLVQDALKVAVLKPGATLEKVEAAIRLRIRSIQRELKPEAEEDFVSGLSAAKRSLRVLCLSRLPPDSPDALLMWAHYTHGHTGFVLGVNDCHPWISGHRLSQPFRDVGDVSYSSARPKSVIGAHERSYYLLKSDHWQYESEVRMIRGEDDPELDAHSLAPVPSDVIASVTLGLNASQETLEAVFAALASNKGLAAVRLFKAHFHADEYRIVLQELVRS